jgi:hypothetical protein
VRNFEDQCLLRIQDCSFYSIPNLHPAFIIAGCNDRGLSEGAGTKNRQPACFSPVTRGQRCADWFERFYNGLANRWIETMPIAEITSYKPTTHPELMLASQNPDCETPGVADKLMKI